jgi:hypothetical protein
MSEEQIVYYRSPSVLVTSGILVIGETRVALSSVRSVTPTQADQGSINRIVGLCLICVGVLVLGFCAMKMDNDPFPIKWFPAVLFTPLSLPFFYFGKKCFGKATAPSLSVSISVSDDEIYNLTFADAHARKNFCNALTRAMAEIR